jgi:hypothetical protein
MAPSEIIPDSDALVATVAAFAPHGESHIRPAAWQTVAAFGLILAQDTRAPIPPSPPLRHPRGASRVDDGD